MFYEINKEKMSRKEIDEALKQIFQYPQYEPVIGSLQACPCCNNTDVKAETDGKSGYWVRCNYCQVAGPTNQNQKASEIAWNMRAQNGTCPFCGHATFNVGNGPPWQLTAKRKAVMSFSEDLENTWPCTCENCDGFVFISQIDTKTLAGTLEILSNGPKV